MRPKTLLLLVVAIACGLVAAFMVNSISGSGTRGDTENYLVPKADIAPNQKIADVKAQFVSKPFAKGVLPMDAIKDGPEGEKKLLGQVPMKPLKAGDPVRVSDLASNQNILKALQPGYRAVTVRADIASALHGFLHAGMRVDVLTIVRDVDNPQLSKSQIFLQNITVLAVNTLSDAPKDKPTVNNPVSMTLMVTPEQLERMYLVSSRSTLGIGLRRPGDEIIVKTDGAISPFEEGKGSSAPGAAPPVNVAVAIADIPEGTKIENFERYFKMMPFQKDQLMGALVITDQSEIQGKPVTRYLAMGQPATQANFTPHGLKPPTPSAVASDYPILIIQNGPNRTVVDFAPAGTLPAAGKKQRSSGPTGRAPTTNGPVEAAPAPGEAPSGTEAKE
jgi:Flp pilus assembly protein CpaB